jgi:hypothetical protein
MRGGWLSFESRFIRDLPIKVCDPNDKADKTRQDKMVNLGERTLKLREQLPAHLTRPHANTTIMLVQLS